MSYEVDRYSPAWAHIALCADLTWTAEPPDGFIIANQRLCAQHYRISQVLHDAAESQSLQNNNHFTSTDKIIIPSQSQDNCSCSGRRSVKDVIPESRLAKFYGNFYYEEVREKYYTSRNERTNDRGYNGQSNANTDLTECWMLPEVEYWFGKLIDDAPNRTFSRRRRQFRMLTDSNFERWDSTGARATGEEAALAARVRSVRPLWSSSPGSCSQRPSTPVPPPLPRKIRVRHRQPRRLAAMAPPPPAYCLEVPTRLFCDPTCKFQFHPPRQPQLTECQRAIVRLSANVQAAVRASAARCLPYRGTNISRFAPTGQRPARCPDRRYVWPSSQKPNHPTPRPPQNKTTDPETEKPKDQTETTEDKTVEEAKKEKPESPKMPKQIASDGQQPSTSAAAMDATLSKKRLYSTVLSMTAPAPINLQPVVRLAQKLTPGLLKLNPKIILPRIRLNADKKLEELEKEALEQYKASDESIDTKFQELEKQAVEEYSTSNSNTSCSSGTSGEKGKSSSPLKSDDKTKKQQVKFHSDKAVDSIVIHSQNFPVPNGKGRTSSEMNLKNFLTPPRGEKKGAHRRNLRSLKTELREASVLDEARHRDVRWTHVQPKKRHLISTSDFLSDDEEAGSIKDARPKKGARARMSAHGAGDLHPIIGKT